MAFSSKMFMKEKAKEGRKLQRFIQSNQRDLIIGECHSFIKEFWQEVITTKHRGSAMH